MPSSVTTANVEPAGLKAKRSLDESLIADSYVQIATHLRAVTDGISPSMQRSADCISKTTDGFVKQNPMQKTLPCVELDRVSETVPMASLSRVLLMDRRIEAPVRHLRVVNLTLLPVLPYRHKTHCRLLWRHVVCCEVLIPAC